MTKSISYGIIQMWLRDWAISITVLHCEPPRI
uniref:Uncharacterized protein n=1 Tax=Siphoviridae sp. ctKcB20 TaxID=2827568 RepID=A0A8S5LKW5_9CAUD|nr:MAG TPA: hypothetical protein [Siphoviridae sp. ctKcB20]